MAGIADLVLDQWVQALVFGPSKRGKTFGALTWPRVNIMDFDNGLRTAIGEDFLRTHGLKADLQYETFIDTRRNAAGVVLEPKAFDDATRYFEACMKPGSTNTWVSPITGKSTKVGRDTFDTWIVDTGTTLSEAAAAKGIWLLSPDPTGGKMKGVKSETHSEALKHNMIAMKQQDYAAERSMVEQFIGMVKDADKHVLFLCHEKELTNDAGNLKGIVPLLTGKGVESICLMFDDIWHLEVKGEAIPIKDAKGAIIGAETRLRRLLRTQTDGIIKCGTRLGVPDKTEFDWVSVSKAVEGNRKRIADLLKKG